MRSNFVVTGLCFGGGTTPWRDRKQPDGKRALAARQRNRIADLDLYTRLFNTIAIKPNMAFANQCLGQAARFGQAQMPEKLVYPQRRARQSLAAHLFLERCKLQRERRGSLIFGL